MEQNNSTKTYCVHYASRYLSITEFWLYQLVRNHKKFTPIFLTRRKENFSHFPISTIYSLDDLGAVRRFVEALLFKTLGYFVYFKSKIERHDGKILHVHFGYNGIKMTRLKNELQIPMVCSFYGDDAYRYPYIGRYARRYKDLFKQADRILALGPYMKSALIKLGCPEQKIAIHHLGIDVNKIQFKPRSVRKTGLRFLIASGFVPKKGIEIAIKALSNFKDSHDFTLDIVGDGPQRDEVNAWVERSGMKNRITLHGFKPHEFLINLAYECDVFLQASRTTENNNKEGTPMAIVDAMATGLPVISTRHSDIPEIVVDGETGYLANEDDIQSFQACIQRVFDHPELLSTFGANGRLRVEQEFNAGMQAEKLEQIYNELIKP